MGLLNSIRRVKYLKILKRETNDSEFMCNVNDLLQQISKCNADITDEKITSHYDKIKRVFLNKSSSDITYLETKKMAYNYHLYLLNDYYNKICSSLFLEKSSN